VHGRRCSDQQHIVPRELHHEIAGEPVRALDDDRLRAVSQQALKHFDETGTGAHRISAGDRSVVKRLD
jgi:hypothetical protein